MSEISDRICHSRRRIGLSQSDVAERLGVSTRTYQRFEKKPDDIDKIKEVATVLDVSPDWILTGIKDSCSGFDANTIPVSLYRGGAGDGVYNFEPQHFLLSLNKDIFGEIYQHGVAAIEIDGDSMEPKFRHGDYILITPPKPNREREDGVYAIRIDDTIKVKALQFMVDGTIKIISYNQAYETEVFDPSQSQLDFQILGKMRLHITR